MSSLHDLVSQVRDEALRDRILEELGKVESKRRFGLVWEDHLVESTRLFGVPIRMNSVVTRKAGALSERYQVTGLDGDQARCRPIADGSLGDECIFDVSSLVPVANFGEPIYPCLTEVDRVENAPDDDTWHTLIEADNYHALQLLRYMYPHKVDCIYIDPPYNTGAKDWKYNNDYVGEQDAYRHSKWLSFIEKRLLLAKDLLNPANSMLIVAIDEKEYLRLGILLEQIFPASKIQMISSVINPMGSRRADEFSRVNEYLFFVRIGAATIPDYAVNMLDSINESKLVDTSSTQSMNAVRWTPLNRDGNGWQRRARPNLFYPLFVNPDTKIVERIGESLTLDTPRTAVQDIPGLVTIWPMKGCEEARWQVEQDTCRQLIADGYLTIGRINPDLHTATIRYLTSGAQRKIAEGIYQVVGLRTDGSKIVTKTPVRAERPRSIWHMPSHSARDYGSTLLSAVIPQHAFPFPKSLYAIEDVLRLVVANKPDALIVDFFAGSGTSAHAVLRLNKQDGGHRRIISVTNNEVGPEDEKKLRSQGLEPGDDEWEALGIARYVTFPRIKAAITGRTPAGDPIKGSYGIKSVQYVEVEGVVANPETGKPMRGRFYQKKPVQNPIVPDAFPMADGFAANAIYFKLGFLDKDAVALGRQFRELLPILWMKAGCHGPCPSIDHEDIPDMLVLPENRMAILVDDTKAKQFAEEIAASGRVDTAYIVTDSPDRHRLAAASVEGAGVKHTFQLHEDYLENFQINIGE